MFVFSIHSTIVAISYFFFRTRAFSNVSFFVQTLLVSLSGKPGFTKKQADLFFPPDFADDFPVAMQVPFLTHCISNIFSDVFGLSP